ncbi:MAG: hypothetical protein NTV86_10240 [Planctomycetota bacterium]|nr:hypothetical protein [Planctomycetota bacterium]
MANDNNLLLSWAPRGHGGTGTVTATLGDIPIHVDKGDITKAAFRRKLVAAICNDRPGITAEQVDSELIRLAADVAQKLDRPQSQGDGETGEFAIVRPERFIHPDVNGLTVTERVILEGKPVGRWALYCRWGDGRRARMELPYHIDLPDKSRLWLHPQPSEPLPTTEPGWSVAGRNAWLEGKEAPDPAELFRQVTEQVAHFLDMPADKAPGVVATLTLWVLLTYIHPVFDAVPYLYVGGPLGSGKSRVFEILARLVFRPIGSSNLTAACLFRTLNNQGGVLLLDEAERLRESTPDVGEILSMLLAGYKRGGKATRLEAVGDTFKTTEFDVYGPKAVACVAGLPPALASRCIPLTMFRASPGSPKPRRRLDAPPLPWQSLRDDLHALAAEHGSVWLDLPKQVDVCPEMSGRNFELWQPLLALAAWIEAAGACGLSEIVKQHALDCIDAGRNDQVPDADEVLLRTVADMVRGGEVFTAGDILTAVQGHDANLFGRWMGRTVSNRLKLYGIPPARKSTNGRRVFDVSLGHLALVQQNYGIDLDIACPDTPAPVTVPARPAVSTVPLLAGGAGGGSGASGGRKD